jgi:hypothetical protein
MLWFHGEMPSGNEKLVQRGGGKVYKDKKKRSGARRGLEGSTVKSLTLTFPSVSDTCRVEVRALVC